MEHWNGIYRKLSLGCGAMRNSLVDSRLVSLGTTYPGAKNLENVRHTSLGSPNHNDMVHLNKEY